MFTRFLATLAISLVAVGLTPLAKGYDASSSILLERYTLLQDGMIQYDQGHLLANGKFNVISTYDMAPSSFFSDDLNTVEEISGMLILYTAMYTTFKAQGLLPKWGTTGQIYYINGQSYVVVTPKGFKVVTIKPLTVQKRTIVAKLGRSASLSASATGTGPLTYQWYFTASELGSDYNQWYRTFMPIAKATKSSYKVCKVQLGDVGTYICAVRNGMSSAVSDLWFIVIQQ